MSNEATLTALVDRVLEVVATVDPDDAGAAAALASRLPLDGPLLLELRAALRSAIVERKVADRENDGVRFSRLRKAATPEGLSVDVVHMAKPALAHTHPRGEIDLCFAVNDGACFDGKPEGWTVYPSGSWHVPTVTGGAMDILYFLPGGAIAFDAR